eukprot:1111894-Rhodomonas_salina.1
MAGSFRTYRPGVHDGDMEANAVDAPCIREGVSVRYALGRCPHLRRRLEAKRDELEAQAVQTGRKVFAGPHEKLGR